MKIAICIGHNEVNKGAFSLYIKQPEWDYYRAIAERMRDVADIYYRQYVGSYNQEISNLAKAVNKQNYDLVIELHFNAAVPSANGCEALYYKNSIKGRAAAKLYCEVIKTNYGSRNRGAKSLSKDTDRGFLFLQKMKAPAIIVEPFFGSNKEALEFKDKLFHETVLREFIKKLSQ